MEIPQLPTDSLYKFFAVAGVTISLFFAYFAIQKNIELDKLTADTSIKVALNMTESAIYKQKIDYLKELLENRYEDSKGATLSKDSRGIVYTNSDIIALKTDINNRFDKSRLESTKNDKLFKKHEELMTSYKIIIPVCYIFFVIGIVIAGIGLYCWKKRIQDLEDEILALTLTNMRQTSRNTI